MNRREFVKSVAGITLVPSIFTLKTKTEINPLDKYALVYRIPRSELEPKQFVGIVQKTWTESNKLIAEVLLQGDIQ